MIVAATIILAGCFRIDSARISVENDPTALRSPDPMVWRPDPTRVIFRNQSPSIHMKIWVGREVAGQPDVELAPEEGRAFNFPGVGSQFIHIKGREATSSGWRDLGIKKRSIEISTFHPFSYTREITVGNWDFSDYYRPAIHLYR